MGSGGHGDTAGGTDGNNADGNDTASSRDDTSVAETQSQASPAADNPDHSTDGLDGGNDDISAEELAQTYFSAKIGLKSFNLAQKGPTNFNANAMFGAPTVENANVANAFSLGAKSYSTNEYGVTTYNGIDGFFGTEDAHSIQGQVLGFMDEAAADFLEAVNLNVTALNIATTETVAAFALGLLTSGLTVSVGLTGISAAANVAEEIGAISHTTNMGIQMAVEVLGILNKARGFAELGGVMGFVGIGYAAYGFSQLGGTGQAGFDGFGHEGGDGGGRGDINNAIRDNEYIINSPIGMGISYNKNIKVSQVQPPITIIQPTQEVQKGKQMEASYKEYRGGLNNILAPHLIQQNEGQEFTNISIDNAMMTSVKEGLPGTSSKPYIYSIPGGYSFSDTYTFSIAKIGNFYYISSENPSVTHISRLELNQPILTIADLINVDITAPTFTPGVEAIVIPGSFDVTASLINIKNSSGVEETYTATVTSDYDTDINNAIANNTPVSISGTCSSGTPDGRTINVNVEGKLFSTVSSGGAFSITISDLSFLSLVLERALWDEYSYAITYYNDTTGYESIPVFTDSWMRKTNNIKLTGLVLPTATDVDSLRVYRIGSYSSVYRRIAEIPNDHTGATTTYEDNIQDVLTSGILDTTNATDVLDLQGVVEHKGSLFAFKNNQVYFSAPGKPNIWSEFQMVRVGGLVTGLASTPLGILIMSDSQQVYLLSGSDKSNFQLSSVSKTVGCMDYKSVSNIRNNAIWLGYEGIMASVGSAVTNLSKGKVDVSGIGTINSSFNYDNIYYLCGSNYTLTIDFRYDKPSFKKINKVINSMTFSLGSINYVSAGTMYIDLYSQGDMLTMLYKSPMFVGASYDLAKEFTKINLVYNGAFTYKVYVDQTEVLSKSITSSKISVEEISLPSDGREGLSLELELIGTGSVYSFKHLFTYLNNN